MNTLVESKLYLITCISVRMCNAVKVLIIDPILVSVNYLLDCPVEERE